MSSQLKRQLVFSVDSEMKLSFLNKIWKFLSNLYISWLEPKSSNLILESRRKYFGKHLASKNLIRCIFMTCHRRQNLSLTTVKMIASFQLNESIQVCVNTRFHGNHALSTEFCCWFTRACMKFQRFLFYFFSFHFVIGCDEVILWHLNQRAWGV